MTLALALDAGGIEVDFWPRPSLLPSPPGVKSPLASGGFSLRYPRFPSNFSLDQSSAYGCCCWENAEERIT